MVPDEFVELMAVLLAVYTDQAQGKGAKVQTEHPLTEGRHKVVVLLAHCFGDKFNLPFSESN